MSQPCSNCGQPTTGKYGICTRPKCRKTASAAYYAANAEHLRSRQRERQRALHDANPGLYNERVRARRLAHPQQQSDYHRSRTRRARELVRSFKIGKSCVDCGLVCTGENFVAFDRDHRPGEVKSFSLGRPSGYRFDRILGEIAKCDLRCANCHRIITDLRRRAA